MCFGFLGIQFGFALQNANVSRIFQTLGADMSSMPLLWVAAPLTGLIVQPIVGYYSDNTWTRLGRRRPYFLYGALVTSIALLFMPNSPTLWIAAGTLWILDASINVTMEPFRAFVGDNLPSKQRTLGYVTQTFFIGIGAVVASLLPYILTNWFGVQNTAPEGEIPDAVRYAFYWGAVVLFLAVGWTVIRSSEYSPSELASFEQTSNAQRAIKATQERLNATLFTTRKGMTWSLVGLIFSFAIYQFSLDPQLYLMAGGCVAFGVLQLIAARLEASDSDSGFLDASRSLVLMPDTMRQLAVVQFFSWFPLFAMWIYSTAAVTSYHFGSSDPTSEIYNEGANWVGVLFGAYNGFSVIAAMIIPVLVKRIGLALTHQLNLILGALGLASFVLIKDPNWLLLSMLGVGFAWASILSIPYAILSDALPSDKMGIYMGIFNFFIVIPQLVAASILGLVLKYIFAGEPIYIMAFAGGMWVLAAWTMRYVKH
ncbi:MAG: MFS transporter [Pseudomonadota bacterium]